MATVYDFKLTDKKGQEVSLEAYKGKVLLIVNSATECGFTPQYDELEALYRAHKAQGLEILDVPCNQFGGQAPGSDAEISEFCSLKFGVDFPQFRKAEVNGENELPLYTLAVDSRDQHRTWLGLSSKPRNYVLSMAYNRSVSIRTSQWKYIIPMSGPDMVPWGPHIETGFSANAQLYNMRSAQDETDNVAEKHPKVVQQLHAQLKKELEAPQR